MIANYKTKSQKLTSYYFDEDRLFNVTKDLINWQQRIDGVVRVNYSVLIFQSKLSHGL